MIKQINIAQFACELVYNCLKTDLNALTGLFPTAYWVDAELTQHEETKPDPEYPNKQDYFFNIVIWFQIRAAL